MKRRALLASLLLCFSASVFAAEKTTLHIGVQAGGTAEWELAALQKDPAYAEASFKIDAQAVANAEAGKIALQSGAVDMIISDWVWVSKMRGNGVDFTFYPYSATSGGLIVPEKSPIHTIKDLKNKRLGIAGGELDKNWLLLQVLAKKNKLDLAKSATKTFAAPPLINEQLKQGRIDAALNYWHFAVRLETQGYRQVIDGKTLLAELGIKETVPMIGYVFKQSWGDSHKQALIDFFNASQKSQHALCTVDSTWQEILPLLKADDTATQTKLRQRYCEGAIESWGQPQQQAAEQIYGLLHKLGNKQLTGDAAHLHPGTFWSTQ